MAIYNGFDINTAVTPAPWGAREEQVIKDIIDTLVGDSIAGAKATSGHLHSKLYDTSGSAAAVETDANGNVGIGTSTPGPIDTTQINATNRTFLQITEATEWAALSLSTDAAVADTDICGMILFGATNEDNGHGIKANIRCYVDGSTATQEGGLIDFQTKADAGNLTSRMTIDEAGLVTVVGTLATNDLDVTTNIDTATMTATGTVGVNDLDVTVNIDTATMTATGTVGVNDLNVTTNIDTATLIATGTVGVNDLDVTTNIDTATMTATGTVGVNDLDVTTNIDTATMTATGTVGINNLDVTTNIDTATLRTTSTVGIGTATPDGTCHIHTATAGTVPVNTNYDELILENNGNTGMSILAPDDSLASIAFGSPSDSVGADISWLYNNHELIIETSGASGFITFKVADSATAMTIDASGEVGVGTTAPEHGIESVLTDATNAKKNIHARSSGANSDAFVGFQNDAVEYSIGVNGTNDAWIIQEDGVATRMTILPTTGNIGFGTATPGSIDSAQITPTGRTFLEVSDSDNWCGLSLSTAAAVADGSITSMILFGALNETSGHGIKANIRCYVDGSTAGQEGGKIDFQTKPDAGSMTSRMVINQAGYVGINVSSPTHALDISNSAATMLLGSDSTGTGRSPTTTKVARINLPHYDLAEEAVSFLSAYSTGSANNIWFGGGSASYNAATDLIFVTAASDTTLSGTERMRITSDGGLYMAGATGGSQGSGTINAVAVYDDGSGPLTDYVFEKHYDKNYVIPEDNEPAKTFDIRYEVCKNLDSLISFIKNKKCFPAFDNGGEKLPIGESFQKLLETVETLMYHFDSINTRLKVLEAA